MHFGMTPVYSGIPESVTGRAEDGQVRYCPEDGGVEIDGECSARDQGWGIGPYLELYGAAGGRTFARHVKVKRSGCGLRGRADTGKRQDATGKCTS